MFFLLIVKRVLEDGIKAPAAIRSTQIEEVYVHMDIRYLLRGFGPLMYGGQHQ